MSSRSTSTISGGRSALPEAAVVDASPLIVLARAGRLDLLQLVGQLLAVPEAVRLEVTAHSDEAARAVDRTDWLVTVATPPIPTKVAAWDLGAGESACLAWAMTNPGAIAVIDDYAARTCAQAMRVEVIGTLGLVLRAKRVGRIESARPVVEDLHRSGLYLSEDLIRQALALVDE